MITETFTIKEMEAEISKNYSAIMGALLKYAPQYKKDFTKRRHAFDYPMVYTTTKRVVIKGNTYITYMTDLTQLKQKLMEEVIAEVAAVPHKRQESIRAQIKALLNS